METQFSLAQLADTDIAEAEKILRSCVHCGFCTATCPTYVLLGDELDSPRGRIYLIKDMLENDRPASESVVKHVDRCLSCLSCMSTCPSGVNYMHLVDHARTHIERTFKRPLFERTVRGLLASVMPFPAKFGVLLRLAKLGKMFSPVMPKLLRGMLSLAPSTPLAKPLPAGRTIWSAEGQRKKRVILMQGCVQQVLAGQINDATIRVLTRLGCDVVVADGSGCCGALTHHLGKAHQALAAVKANVRAWTTEIDGEGVDAIVVNASGCGTTVKDYGFMLRNDKELADAAERISGLTQDISEFLVKLGNLSFTSETAMKVTYHSACSLQHGQKVTAAPKSLLENAGFSVSEPLEPHMCCGSAGTYNLMQPEIAGQLRDRKAANIARTAPEVVATGNIGCLMQLREVVDAPVVHTVELLDWATGGPPPNGLPQTASEQ
ncbi:MAG: glycolate oxidase subunit GlcF [Pseudomonadota bacterium]|nr:glycolate oxidase subunit GlcF [Pseudomonadota bacterium]